MLFYRRLWVVLLVSLLIATMATPLVVKADTTTWNLTAHARDDLGWMGTYPIAGATVEIWMTTWPFSKLASGVTNANGVANLSAQVAVGDYLKVKIWKSGYCTTYTNACNRNFPNVYFSYKNGPSNPASYSWWGWP